MTKKTLIAALIAAFPAFATSPQEVASTSGQSSGILDGQATSSAPLRSLPKASLVCEALNRYPRPVTEKLSWEVGEISPICKPFVRMKRSDLDRCGDVKGDPYAKAATTTSSYTWPSRLEMKKRGKGNLHTDPELRPQLTKLESRIEALREQSADLCCGSDSQCREALNKVQVSVCQPPSDPNQPDPCVFGGSYKMPGRGYSVVFRTIRKIFNSETREIASGTTTSGASETQKELRKIVDRNLSSFDRNDEEALPGLDHGQIILSSYVSRNQGVAALEPVILHEMGHACSMVKMQQMALSTAAPDKALRATHWLDRARKRCQADVELPEAFFDFWESVGESRGLASCLHDLATANQKQLIDRPCPGLCPGHYLEESVGVAFSLLLGELGDSPSSVFPKTCDHIRDGQHPMVNDVVECLTQHSPRFRARLRSAYSCARS